jgi:hypothetical protein
MAQSVTAPPTPKRSKSKDGGMPLFLGRELGSLASVWGGMDRAERGGEKEKTTEKGEKECAFPNATPDEGRRRSSADSEGRGDWWPWGGGRNSAAGGGHGRRALLGNDEKQSYFPDLVSSTYSMSTVTGRGDPPVASSSSTGYSPITSTSNARRGRFSDSPPRSTSSFFRNYSNHHGGASTPPSRSESIRNLPPLLGSPSVDPDPTNSNPNDHPPPPTERPRRAAFMSQMKISIPTPSFHVQTHSAHHSKTPGWSEPYLPNPAYTSAYTQSAATRRSTLNSQLASRTRAQRWWAWVGGSHWVPLVGRGGNFVLTAVMLGLAIKIRALEKDLGLDGLTGSSPVVAIIYAPLLLLHILLALYVEYLTAKPIGLWSLPHKLTFTSLDLLTITLMSSLLSLTLSDLLSTPIQCVSPNSRWWTPFRPVSAAGTGAVRGVGQGRGQVICGWQIGLASLVLAGTVGFLLVNLVSLGRVFAKVTARQRPGGRR